MNRDSFKQLLKGYVSGTATDEERALIDHWYELLYNDSFRSLDDSELSAVEQEMWEHIERESKLSDTPLIPIRRPLHTIVLRWVAAVAVFAMLGFSIYALVNQDAVSLPYQIAKKSQHLDEIINDIEETKSITLADGSTVVLKAFSRLAFPAQFSERKREVYLEGEAFFDVAKNPSKPFVVHAGNLLTQVLGTSFDIQSDNEIGKMVVSVKTGKVMVSEDADYLPLNKEQKKSNGTIITPNQQIVYDVKNRNFITQLVENPEPLQSDTAKLDFSPSNFDFDDEKLVNVFEKIGKTYGIDILVENENSYNEKFTGDISKQSLYDMLNLICLSTNHEYEIKGTKILIKNRTSN
ncbi:FecR family protein [Sphingobacterium hungaricum]